MRKQWHCKIGVGEQDALHYGFHEGGDQQVKIFMQVLKF